MTAQFEKIAIRDVTFERLAGTSLGKGAMEAVSLSSSRLHDRLGRDYLLGLRARLRSESRPVRISPFIDREDGLTLEVNVSLREGEEGLTHDRILSKLGGEDAVLRTVDRIDPLWAVMDVEAGPFVLEDLTTPGGHLPDCGYWGSKVVSVLGGAEVRGLVAKCPKAVYLAAGGFFMDWKWYGEMATSKPAYRSFVTACGSAGQRVYRALRTDLDRR